MMTIMRSFTKKNKLTKTQLTFLKKYFTTISTSIPNYCKKELLLTGKNITIKNYTIF